MMLLFGVIVLSVCIGCGGSHAASVSGKTQDVHVTITGTGQTGGVSMQQTVVVVVQISE